ncbi:centrosomal protein of 70 kda-like [Plakobranchus ocellatus]|uniref:Centrosomal protein of 70 kDa n=1 Tax=Plakobranchus ocellatus TaxID=259542 RepID=A0AAV3Y0W7_9GAST|nr:centrosomal protein of 70 kda-like [Plakobranchus ocellatus]
MAEKTGGRYTTVDIYSDGELSVTEIDKKESFNARDEIKEWMNVNRKLRNHGLNSIRVLPSQDVDVKSGRYICLDLESSLSLRTALTALITDVDRKESVVQDLNENILKLQQEMNDIKEESAHATSKAKDIKVMLQCSRARVQELEDQQSHSSSTQVAASDETERLRNTKVAMGKRCRQLEAKVDEQEKELERLRRELLTFAEEDDRRRKRQSQVFSEFKKRTSRPSSATDQRLLDIIDSYENQIHGLRRQIEANRGDSGPEMERDFSNSHSSAYSRNFKAIIKSYEKQLREKDRLIESLECEKDMVMHNLDSRPEPCDYRVLAQRVKKLENLLCLHNISIPGEKNVKDPFYARKKFSTRLEDLDYLPLEQCHFYLKQVCCELQIDNLDCIAAVLQEMKESNCNSDRFMEYCRELSEIVESVYDQHNFRSRFYRGERSVETVLCDSNMRYYLDVVSNWCKDISCLGELQCAINSLLDKTVPWLRAHMETDHSVAEMVELLERVVHSDRSPCVRTVMDEVCRSTLEEIVSHFQTLFDTPRISGVLPRMNEVYRVLGELRNVQNTLKSQLGLPEDAHSSALVDAVGKICHMHNSTTAKQLKRLLQTDDLNGVMRRLDEHTEFFPAFQCIMHKLFNILGVCRMDEVIPAVRALKLLAS